MISKKVNFAIYDRRTTTTPPTFTQRDSDQISISEQYIIILINEVSSILNGAEINSCCLND
jgi:hypothetical protein